MSQKIHFLGVGGSGISGVANLAKKYGFEVTGCDIESNTAYGSDISIGHSPKHLIGVDKVVVSPALFYSNNKNAELLEAKKEGKLITWQKFVSDYLAVDKTVICISGTHGKSTTTAMVGRLLTEAGLDPTVVIGANVSEWGGNFRYGNGKYIVIEADEFNDNFLNYHPNIIIINNIEFDHPDYFIDLDHVRSSFKKFVGNLVGEKILITENNNLHRKFNLKVTGAHNQDNANMVYLLGKHLQIRDDVIVKSLESFTGIGRRMELIANRGGVSVFDDYAHHPTAVKTTLNGLRDRYKNSRIITVFEPHGFKRTKMLAEKYKGVFEEADKVYIGPIFAARDSVDTKVTPSFLAEKIGHKNCKGYESFTDILTSIRQELKEGDVVLVMGAGKSYLWAREIVKVLPSSFSDLTTFKIGGKIEKYFEVQTRKEIDNAIKYAENNKLPIFIVGEGSDILVSDKDFNGVVIKYTNDKYKYLKRSFGCVELTGFGGLNWDRFVEIALKYKLQGIECLSGIPGTVGAAPIQNIGAYGQEIKDVFISLRAYNMETRKFVTFLKDDLKFGYRESVFKSKGYWQKYIIISVTLKLITEGKPEVKYESLKTYLEKNKITKPTLESVRNAVLDIRSKKFENPKVVGNAGSFFKNPIVSKAKKQELVNLYPDLKIFPIDNKFKIAAGWLIEKAGWKGKRYKTAGVSPNHALILVNPDGNAKALDVYTLSEMIIRDVMAKFDIRLEREVQLINF